jgi:hypothetical protein
MQKELEEVKSLKAVDLIKLLNKIYSKSDWSSKLILLENTPDNVEHNIDQIEQYSKLFGPRWLSSKLNKSLKQVVENIQKLKFTEEEKNDLTVLVIDTILMFYFLIIPGLMINQSTLHLKYNLMNKEFEFDVIIRDKYKYPSSEKLRLFSFSEDKVNTELICVELWPKKTGKQQGYEQKHFEKYFKVFLDEQITKKIEKICIFIFPIQSDVYDPEKLISIEKWMQDIYQKNYKSKSKSLYYFTAQFIPPTQNKIDITDLIEKISLDVKINMSITIRHSINSNNPNNTIESSENEMMFRHLSMSALSYDFLSNQKDQKTYTKNLLTKWINLSTK